MATKLIYPSDKDGEDILLRLREEYEQAVLDWFDDDDEVKEVRPALEVIGHTSNFLDNLRLPVHRWFRYSAGFSAEWVKWLLAERRVSELHSAVAICVARPPKNRAAAARSRVAQSGANDCRRHPITFLCAFAPLR